MPSGIFGRITGRSSSIRRGLLVHEGIIDPGFRGELFAAVTNLNDEPVRLTHHERIAQLVFAPAIRPLLSETLELPPADRGEKGFGSSGR